MSNVEDRSDMALVVTNVGVVSRDLKRVPDLASGGERTHRYGCWLSLNIFPDLDKSEGVLILPAPPTVIVTADSLEDLEARLISEVKSLVKHADNTLREVGQQDQKLPDKEE